MPRKAKWPPPVSRHRSGNARVTIDRADYYLGPYGSPEASEAYAALVKRIEAERSGKSPSSSSGPLSVTAIAVRYLSEQERERKTADGPTVELDHIRRAVRTMTHAIGSMSATEVLPRHIKLVRMLFIEGYEHPKFGPHKPQARKTVHQNFNRCRAVFRWAAEEKLIPAEVYAGLAVIRALRPEEAGVKEMPDVRPVPEADLAKTLPHIGPIIRQMVDVQLLTGCRPGEICRLKMADVDRSQAVWQWRLLKHKNAWRGHKKLILIGPKAQAVLAPFLTRDPNKPCFSPRDAYDLTGHDWRGRKDGRGPTEEYSVNSYEQAIERACARAGVPQWSPNQLRHNAATRIKDEFGLEVARIILGHKSLQTTEIYAEENLVKALLAAKSSG